MHRQLVKGEGNTPKGALGSFHNYYYSDSYSSTAAPLSSLNRYTSRSYTTSGKLYPNGEFSFGYVKKLRARILDERYSRYESEHALRFSSYWDAHSGIVREYYREGDGGLERAYHILGLSKVSNSHSSVSGDLGRKRAVGSGISGLGRKLIRNGGYIINTMKIAAGFYTFTLPRLAQEDYEAVFDDWANILVINFCCFW
jgi:hypothetical protein